MKTKNSVSFSYSVPFYAGGGGRPVSTDVMHTEELLMESWGLIIIIHNIRSHSMGTEFALTLTKNRGPVFQYRFLLTSMENCG